MSLVPCEPTGSSFSTPGLLPVLLPIPDLTPSHSIPVSTHRPFKAKTEPSVQAFPRVRLPQAQ
jgi:hypothetical protein